MNLLIIFCPLPAGHRGGTAPRIGGSARQFQTPLESTRFSHREGRKKSVRKSDPLGGTEGSNLSPSTGESIPKFASHLPRAAEWQQVATTIVSTGRARPGRKEDDAHRSDSPAQRYQNNTVDCTV